MPYIGNTIRAADDYRLIDDISSGFNGSETSFALQVAGSAPVPFPKSPQQVLISVNGVIQEPDPTGSSGFNLVGTNIVFSSAPTNGHAFFGIIYATADYLNAGGNFPAGSLGAPSITFIGDENSGLYRKSSGSVGFVSDATEIANFDSNGITISSGNIIIPDSIIHNGDTNTKIRFPAADTVSIETAGSEALRVDSSRRVQIGTAVGWGSNCKLHVSDTSSNCFITISAADNGNSVLAFSDTAATVRGALDYDHDGDFLGIKTAATERLRINSSGRLLIGSTVESSHGGIDSALQIIGTGTDDSSITMSRFSNDHHSAYLVFAKSRNGSIGGNTVVQDDDSIGRIIFFGNDGTDGNTPAAEIDIEVDGSPGSNDMPGRIVFRTTADGASSVTERMRIGSNGNVGIGTASPSEKLEVSGDIQVTSGSIKVTGATPGVRFTDTAATGGFGHIGVNNSSGSLVMRSDDGNALSGTFMGFEVDSSERMRIDSSGRLGIATTSPTAKLHIVESASTPAVIVKSGTSSNQNIHIKMLNDNDSGELVLGVFGSAASTFGNITATDGVVSSNQELCLNSQNSSGIVKIGIGSTPNEVARFTHTSSEDRLIIGGTNEDNTSGESSWMGLKLKGARPYLVFHEDDRSGEAQHGFVAHTTGALFVAKMAGRIAFSVSDSGAVAEVMNLQKPNLGLRVGASSPSSTFDEMRLHSGAGREGLIQRLDASNVLTTSNQHIVRLNRCTTDGMIVQFLQDGSQEGDISVSGSTVSYNGGHLSRWSQLKGISSTDKSARPTIYQGTVMSNLDELCSWTHEDYLYDEDVLYTSADTIPEGKEIGDIKHAKGDVLRAGYTEENQQLNMTKVSDTEGDKDVAGVFWTWDDDDDEIVNDFYIAMTGDMVIRVAASTTVARGDLMISAGDGTAKPQADDIVRSSTIAKIISTNHTATYADGSKAYPCVLMAC